MAGFFKKRWVLFLVLIVFTVCKLPQLHYAYYWDESWPYAVAIKAMYTHGISLMPTAIDPELSRGHPLFFHAIAALWMNIFGASHVSMHSFALVISLLFLVTVYEAGLKLFDQRAAVISIVLVSMQMIFFVQSSFVLFDMLVAFLSFLSIYLYAKEKYLLTAICLSVLFYTKESGLIAGFVIGIHALAGLFNRDIVWRARLYRLASIAVPCILIGIFFLIQKHIRGWYIFPLYNGLIEHKWDNFWYCFKVNCVSGTIVSDFRNWDCWLLLAISVIATIKNKNYRYLVLFFPGLVIYYCTDDMRSGRIMPGIPFFILFIISIVAMLLVLVKLKVIETATQKKFIGMLCAFIFCFWCFSAMNFFTPRYLLAAIVPLLFFAAVVLASFIQQTYRWLFYPVLLLILAIGIYDWKTDTNYGDSNFGAFEGIDVQQHVVDFFEQHDYYNKNIGCLFLENQHLSNAASGFLHTAKVFSNVGWDINNKTDFAIFDNIEPDPVRYGKMKKDPDFQLVYRCQKGMVWAEVYGRK